MKNIKILPLLMSFILLFVGYSCNEDDFSKEDFGWTEEITTLIEPVDSKDFIFAINSDYFFIDELQFMISVFSESGGDTKKINKLELYAFLQETVNGENIYHGGEEGKLIKTFTEVSDFNMIEMAVSVNEIYNLFADDFVNTDRLHKLIGTDMVEFKWVLTDEEGNVTDKRKDYSSNNNFIFGVDAVYDCEFNFEGTINYEVIEMGTIWATGAVGDKGSIDITRLSLDGGYSVSDAGFGHYLFGPAILEFYNDNCGDAIRFQDNSQEIKWSISNINGPTCQIKWVNRLTVYGVPSYITVLATRADGKDWPVHLVGDSTL